MLHKELQVETFSLSGGAFLLDLPRVDKAVLCLVVISCELVIYRANWVEIVAAVEASCLGASWHQCEHQQGAFAGAGAEVLWWVALLTEVGKG